MVAVELSLLVSKAGFPPQVIKSISAQEEQLIDEYAHLWIQMLKVFMMGSERLFFSPALLIYSKGSFICSESPAVAGHQGSYCGMTEMCPECHSPYHFDAFHREKDVLANSLEKSKVRLREHVIQEENTKKIKKIGICQISLSTSNINHNKGCNLF